MYYIGIEDLVANALIELVERDNNRTATFETLSKYATAILAHLTQNKKEALLLLSRDKTNEFIHNCTNYFTVSNDGLSITLNEGIETKELRKQFRVKVAFNVLLAFLSKDALQELGLKVDC